MISPPPTLGAHRATSVAPSAQTEDRTAMIDFGLGDAVDAEAIGEPGQRA